jgi:cytochrome c oxidase subunit 2
MRVVSALLIALGAGALGAASASAFTITTNPGASPNAQAINEIYILALVFGLAIFVGVQVSLGYCLWRYRARKGRKAEQIHGNTRLEIGWSLGAVAVLIVLAVFTFVKLGTIIDPQNSGAEGEALLGEKGPIYAVAEKRLPPSKKYLEINVVGRQYIWQFVYPGGTGPEKLGPPYSYEEMVVPTETTILINAVSVDVVHSWWVPALGGKVQVVPGYHNYTWFKLPAKDAGMVFHGQCATLCGRDHARMIATVRAVTPAQFEAWLEERKRELVAAGEEAAKARELLAEHKGPESVEHP